MGQLPVELILTRQLASHLTMPMFVVDQAGTLIYFNEPAEPILGRRFDETGDMPLAEWATVFKPADEDGRPLAPDEHPMVIATNRDEPVHRRMWIQGLDGVRHRIEGTALPLRGHGDRRLGAVGIFWEVRS